MKYSTEKKVYLMTNKTRKIYTEEFKAATVKLIIEGKQSIPEAAKSLGIGKSTLYKWIEQLSLGDNKDSKNNKLKDESKRLRSEVVELKKKLKARRHWPSAFWRLKSPSKNLADGKLRTQLWRHCL